jgi:hypothetical protein
VTPDNRREETEKKGETHDNRREEKEKKEATPDNRCQPAVITKFPSF